VPVRQCAEALVRGIEHRRRRIYVPRAIAGVQALRTSLHRRGGRGRDPPVRRRSR
jgi:hypothetical protein